MSFKDLTESRLRDFRRQLRVLADDLDDFLRSRNDFESYSRHSAEKQLDDREKYPSVYYSFRFVNSVVEIRRGKDSCIVFCKKVDFSADDLKQIQSRFSCDVDYAFNQTRFVLPSLDSAVDCFLFVCRIYTKSLELAQGVLIF